MARRTFVFDPPDRFVAGTIGQPGNRTFFLQARTGSRVVSVSLEKVQVAALAERLGRLLFELDERGDLDLGPEAPAEDVAPLDEPLAEAFRVGTLTLGWDGNLERVLIEAGAMTDTDSEEVDEDDEEEVDEDAVAAAIQQLIVSDDADGPDVLQVHLTAAAARAFVERTLRVVRAGRPPCPLCGNPLDPQGHICPRRNGQYVH
ncbi:MAG: DUF3090 domain-containing protein [Chloroflexi bacterium]|nr:DUF3090 domain-containing protein [Chloroflexota bacterium]